MSEILMPFSRANFLADGVATTNSSFESSAAASDAEDFSSVFSHIQGFF